MKESRPSAVSATTMSMSLVNRGSPKAIVACEPVTRYGSPNSSSILQTWRSSSDCSMRKSPRHFVLNLFVAPIGMNCRQHTAKRTPRRSPQSVANCEPIGFGFGAKHIGHAVVNHIKRMRQGVHDGILTVGPRIKKHVEITR